MDDRSVAEQASWEYSVEYTLQDQIQLLYYIRKATGLFRYLHSLLLCLYSFMIYNYIIWFHIYLQGSSLCLR